MRRRRKYTGDLTGASDAADASVSAADDLAKRVAEAQQIAIVTGAQQSAAGFKQTAAQIQTTLTRSLLTYAVVGGGIFVLGRRQGWF